MSNNIETLFNTADNYLEQGQLSSAQKTVKEIISLAPDNQEAYMLLGSINGELGNTDEAISNLTKSISLKPNYADAFFILGHIYKSLNKYQQAQNSFLKAVEFEPSDWEYCSALSNFYYDSKKFALSIDALEKTIAIKPEDLDSILKLANAYKMQGNYQSAQNNYKRVINSNACNIDIFKALIFLDLEHNKLENTEALIQQALDKYSTNDQDIYYYKSILELKKDDATNAIDSINQAISIEQNKNEFIIHKALILEALNDYDQALELLTPLMELENIPFQAAVVFAKLSPTFDMKEDAIKILKVLINKGSIPVNKLSDIKTTINWLENQ